MRASYLIFGFCAHDMLRSADAFVATARHQWAVRRPDAMQTLRSFINRGRVPWSCGGFSSSTMALPSSAGPGNVHRQQNEFSRTYKVDDVLGPRKRDYAVAIRANDEELKALAERFKLSNIAKLEADLVLRRDVRGGRKSENCVQAEGTVMATVTQKCVRTNEDFDVDLEFSLSTTVRAIESGDADNGKLGGMDVTEFDGSRAGGGKRKKDRRRLRGTERQIDEMGMKDLQDLLMDFDLEDDIIEDENCFSSDGVLDVGELVAQIFRLKLDPYPKKPGSEPIRYTFTA